MGDFGMIKGGLAWKLSRQIRIFNDEVVDHWFNRGLGVYRKEEGEETINIKQT